VKRDLRGLPVIVTNYLRINKPAWGLYVVYFQWFYVADVELLLIFYCDDIMVWNMHVGGSLLTALCLVTDRLLPLVFYTAPRA
jgi:hypothetical protein